MLCCFARSISKSKTKEETVMKSLHIVLLLSLLSFAAVTGHSLAPTTENGSAAAGSKDGAAKRGPVFRANKDQVIAAQNALRSKGVYSGEATGKLDAATRDSIKSYQGSNGLRATGTLNRATLEKMGIALTDKQKAIPASASSYASAEKSRSRKTKSSSGSGESPRRAVFRATKEQVIEAQRLLKTGGMYAGEETGKLDDPTREGLKKYQEANGVKATGTLNQATLEKMGIALTDKQKTSADRN
jgi:peptidoglycan hydrolase-like protein with peptidoglycan-binding domain